MENQDPERKPRKNLSLRNKFTIQKRDNRSSKTEPDDPAANSKPVSLLGAENSASTSSHGLLSDVVLSENNDSLCDFKSPVRNELADSLADFKIEPKALKRLQVRKESKPVAKKKRRNRDVAANAKQPSIESSFFKPPTPVQTAFLCPLCFKACKDSAARHSHMKTCAAKNKISTEKLLDAVELQEKQTKERTALGLLAAPPIQPKKTVSKKLISDKDPQLQLALALSMSLHEAQLTEQIEDAHLLAGEAFVPVNAEMSEERRKTLKNFGFTTNKPLLASTSGRSKKKRPAGPTVLQNRTQEERDRLLTVRIAEVLMGDDAITQTMKQDVQKVLRSEDNVILRSRLLRSYHRLKDRLWEKTQKSLSSRSYSCNLLGLSLPPEDEPEDEGQEPEPSELEPLNPGPSNAPDVVHVDNENIVSPIATLEITPTRSIVDDKKRTGRLEHDTDRNSAINLSRDWSSMVGASYMSDVTIIAKGGAEIHAHQTVLWLRCPHILSEMIKNDPAKYWETQSKILWPETDTDAAYGFLEFVYTGVIYKHVDIFDYPEALTGIRTLARKYRLKELFAYLRDKGVELESKKAEGSKSETNVESKGEKDSEYNSRDLEEDKCSSSLLEIDMNSQSSVHINVTSHDGVAKERDSDSNNIGSGNFESLNLQGDENKSNNLPVIDCFSSSNDSSATHTPKALKTAKGTHEVFSKIMSQRAPDMDDRKNHNNLEVEEATLEDSRCCISPDIFDDSTTVCYPYDDAMLEENSCNTEHDANFSTANTENSLIKSLYLGKKTDTTMNTSQHNESEKPTVDCTFVSTRRRGRPFKLVSDDSNSNVESDPEKRKEKNVSGPSSRPKGEITMAIEEMQRLNAKTASDLDSESESMEILPVRRPRNPFRINVTNTSSMIEENKKDDPQSGPEDEIPFKRRHKLSIFEEKIQIEAAKNPEMFNLTTFKPATDLFSHSQTRKSNKSRNQDSDRSQTEVDNEDRIEPSQRGLEKIDDTVEEIFDLTQESSRESEEDSNNDMGTTNPDDQDLSMFSKYKKEHRHNSIDKYLTALKNLVSSRASKSVIEDTDDASSSDDMSSLNDALSDADKTKSRRRFSSKYEYTDPDQSTSNFHKELTNISMEDNEIEISDESLDLVETNKDQSAAKVDDTELSDLEIELSNISTARSMCRLDASKLSSQSQRKSIPNKNSVNLNIGDKQKADETRLGIDSLSDVKLDDTDFTIMKNNSESKKTNISDQETDTEYCMEPVSEFNKHENVGQLRRRSDTDEEKSSDIYNEETDPGEMEDENNSRFKINYQETPKSRSLMENRDQSSSPDCKISGTYSPVSVAFEIGRNLSNEVDELLEECKTSSQIYREAQETTSHPLKSGNRESYHQGIGLLNRVSDSEFDNMDYMGAMDFPENDSWNVETPVAETSAMRKFEEPIAKDREKSYCLDSETSDSGEFNIPQKKTNASISLSNRSKAIRKRSKQLSHRSITPESNSPSSLRHLKVKSKSENIIRTTTSSGGNLLSDSCDSDFCKLQTPPTQPNVEQVTPQRETTAENITPLANYSAMKSPELRKELQKYGFKAQKRHRAKQLLRHIYNELHPLVPADKTVQNSSNESSGEAEIPTELKRLNRSKSLGGESNRKITSNAESLHQYSDYDLGSMSDASDNGVGNYDSYTLSQSDECESLENAFLKLIKADKSLHHKVLTYEPLVLEELYATLKAQGVNCKQIALMDFLDKQCITFRTLASAKRNRTKQKGSPTKNQGTQRAGKNVKK